jgi:hypothetical protein
MAPESSVRGGKMIALYGLEFANSGTEIFPHFSEIRIFPEISRVIGNVSPLPLLVSYIPRSGRHFRNFPDISPMKNENVHQVGSN